MASDALEREPDGLGYRETPLTSPISGDRTYTGLGARLTAGVESVEPPMAQRSPAQDHGPVGRMKSVIMVRNARVRGVLQQGFRYTLLIFLCAVNFITYLDRGVVAGTLPAMEEHFDISHTQAGVIAGAFMVGFIFSSPIFAHLIHYLPAFKLIAIGLCAWTISTCLTGVFNVYWLLVFTRCFVGIGEASFVGISPVFIDEYAPAMLKSVWLGIFYMMLPVGGAVGYAFGGQVNDLWGWQWAFLLEAMFMAPFGFFALFVRVPLTNKEKGVAGAADEHGGDDGETERFDRRGTVKRKLSTDSSVSSNHAWESVSAGQARIAGDGAVESESFSDASQTGYGTLSESVPWSHLQVEVPGEANSHMDVADSPSALERDDAEKPEEESSKRTKRPSFMHELMALLTNPTYILTCAGYAAYIFVFGGFAVWGPKYITSALNYELTTADYAFGSITVVTGVFGAVLGGVLMDVFGKTTTVSLRLCLVFTIIATPLCVIAFIFSDPWLYFSFCFLGMFFLMCCTTPVAGAILWCVPPDLRSFAMSFSVFIIHLFGDFPSPIMIGALLDVTNNPHLTMVILCEVLLFSCVFWFFALIFSHKAKSY